MVRSRSIFVKAGLYVLSVALLVYVVVFMPTPYMINQPGTAEEVGPMVTIPSGDKDTEGEFLLTTVSVSYANLWMLATSKLNSHAEVVRKEEGRNDEEYLTQQHYYMSNSQSSAMMAAYKKAGVKYAVIPEYVFIIGLSKTIQPKGDYHPGDVIREVNGVKITRFEELSDLIRGKQPGDHLSLELERNGKVIDQTVELVEISDAEGSPKAGLGVAVGEMRKVKPESEDKVVTFADTRIGGPSAGLMFTLEIYNQLTEGDLTKGYRVAGTGTISEDGKVGPIGGVEFKIVASDREGAEIFFVPEENYKDAKAKADKIGSSIRLVPVKHVDDALEYLHRMEPKS